MNIYMGTDHAGFALKERLKKFLQSDYSVIDFGCHSSEPCDYPDFIMKAARAVQTDPSGRGIILGGSGQGEAMCANRLIGVRAVVYYGDGVRCEDGTVYDIIDLSREHNDANVLSIGARFVHEDTIFMAVNHWLTKDFSNQERHIRRLRKFNGDHYGR